MKAFLSGGWMAPKDLNGLVALAQAIESLPGWEAETHAWDEDYFDDLAARVKAGEPVALFGHSWGAAYQADMLARLDKYLGDGARVPLVGFIDQVMCPTFNQSGSVLPVYGVLGELLVYRRKMQIMPPYSAHATPVNPHTRFAYTEVDGTHDSVCRNPEVHNLILSRVELLGRGPRAFWPLPLRQKLPATL